LKTLDTFSVGEAFLAGLSTVFNKTINIGEINFTLWDITVFVIVLLAAFAFTNTVKFFLQEDVLPRFSMQRGLPDALLKMVQYTMLLGGFLMAMAAAGLDLNRFTFLAGAFGVGVGFGLQNIFNNFASGLILLFERPINVDDIIEIGGVSGQVKHIGIRSSMIRTAQGAEIIIPNSNFVSSQFTNWTYSDLYRRIDLKVGVAYGTEPERVMKLLKDAALDAPGIEKEPEPMVVFRGFGDNSLNFELRCWVLATGLVEAESDLGVAVEAALRRAGIEIPFPQLDLHLRSTAEDINPKLTKEENAKHAN
jgi:small-conductance mechanosensitive channel